MIAKRPRPREGELEIIYSPFQRHYEALFRFPQSLDLHSPYKATVATVAYDLYRMYPSFF